MERPKLTDPKEFALVKQIYFPAERNFEQVDEIEQWDRMQHTHKNNQAR